MYEGSMVGSGINVFAVWNYIIVKARRGVVEINPKLLAFKLGGEEREVREALEFLQRPDPDSRSKLEEGRRIVREGEFQYRLVNWEHYDKIRNEADRREYNRLKQAEYRERDKVESVRPQRKRAARNNPVKVGLVATTDKLAEMVGEFGDPSPETDPAETRSRLIEKIKNDEQVQEAVRRKFNPGHKDPDKHPPIELAAVSVDPEPASKWDQPEEEEP
jgi:hypothetical protein